ncbi:uncharacterized protein MONOS_10574 [Monocercomonoides exilis]|uniref:uncharacterized protein n=1 Tax=Monocercomonoides exilis TaxID=2049356 RepID=UPI00355A369B|nr:hypothetical protein MONOS_10574 [Monocercomonoides exilis]|eukprot:MONOS_10574.1-p1 / transcript=MONOS_10574.1 / gene=MONOS_10574 / organism=Monocercomonoides_exilis_PA203 / gene_product=unspecified product / transcript_product=unspecified product / location=Mono_scaffold00486:2197-10374(-) / protein_length=2725 / sequence_SO=supercontig / SO=protein_coding / is_pseudo=false
MLFASVSVFIIISSLLCTGDTAWKGDESKKNDLQEYSIGGLGNIKKTNKIVLSSHNVYAIKKVNDKEMQDLDSFGLLTNTEKNSKRLPVDAEREFNHNSVVYALNDGRNEWSWIRSRMMVLNASLAVERIKIDQRCTSAISVRNELSTLSVSNCIINAVTETELSPFDCAGGTIRMMNISFQRTFRKQAWPSLVSASSCTQPLTGRVHVLCCTFSSFCASFANPFIGDADLSFASASFCSFHNISVQSNNKNLPQKHSLQESKMEGCMAADCVCPFYGVLISGSCGCGFGSSNTSFIRSRNTISHQNFTSEAQSFSEGEIKFEDCSFTECSATQGGAIAVSESAKLTVDKCTFSECIDTYNGQYGYGGAIFSNGSDCNIENSLFNCCKGTGDQSIGGAFAHIKNEFSLILGCTFENCSAAYGGSVGWYIGGSGSIYNTAFKCSRALLWYAGTVFLGSPPLNFVISNCYLFEGNAQNGAGGFDASSNDHNKNLKIQFCLFENNTVNEPTHAADIFIGKGFGLTNKTVQILQSFTLSTAPRKVVQCVEYAGICGDRAVAHDSYLPTAQPEIHISNSGRNVDTCGGTGSECQTVEYGVTRWNSYLGQNVFMASEEFKEGVIDIDWRNIVLIGTESNSSAIKCNEASSNDCLISIGNGSLNAKRIQYVCVFNRSAIAVGSSGSVQLELCSFTKNAQSTQPSTKSLIQVDEGSLTMEFVNVSGFSFSQGCAIALSDCKTISLANASFWDVESGQNGGCMNAVWSERAEDGCSASISGCTFEHCVVSGDGNGGGALFLSLPSTCSATILECSFEECEAPFDSRVGFGGGIFLNLERSNAAFAITSPSFSSEKPNKAKHGNDLFVQSPDLKESITNETLPFAYALGHGSFDDLRGFHGNDHEHSIPLVLFLEEVGSTIHVGSEDGADTVVCGFSDYQCQSVDYCVERLTELDVKTIAVIKSATIKSEMNLHSVSLKSSDDLRAGVTCAKSLNAVTGKVIAATGNVSVELIHFLLPSSLDAEIETLIFLTSESNMSLTKCVFGAQMGEPSQISYWLLRMCGGILNIDDCQIDSDCLCQAPISVSDNGAAAPTVISLKVNGFILCDYPLIHVITSSTSKLLNDGATSDKAISLSQCSFEGITNGNANSAVLISSLISSQVECLHWNITNAKGAESMEGGAMKVVVEAQGQFTMENATFTKCCAECETGGKGGGVYFDCSASNAFSFQQIAFDQCSAKHGKNMFFLSSDLNVSITKQTLAFEVSETAGDSNLFVGNDSTKTNFDLCRFLIGFASQEIHLSKSSGWDVLRCGSAEEPCATMEFGQNHFRALEEPAQQNMNTFLIVDEARVSSEVDISNITVTSVVAKSRPALTFGAAISPQAGKEEESDSVLTNTGTCTLINIEICCGDGSEWKQTKLISTAGSAFAAQSCSFTSTSEAAIPYCVVACLTGTCEISFCSFQSIKCKSHILMASHESSIDLTNVSMSNMELMGKSLVTVLAQAEWRGESQRLNEGGSPTVQLKCCTLHSLLQNAPSEPSIISCTGSEPCSVSVQNTSTKNCGSSESEKGGGLIMSLSEGGFFECRFSAISECFCSESGRGGAIFLDCSSIASDGPLPFLLENTTFVNNKALTGRDLYVRCTNIKSQISIELFQLDFRPPFVRDLAMWGCTAQNYYDEEDLLELIVGYQSETIFASSSADNASDTLQCGAISGPCSSLNVALSHIIPSAYSNLLIDKSALASGEASARDVTIKSLEQESDKGVLHLNFFVESKTDSLVTCSSRVKLEFLTILFGNAFSSSHLRFLSLADGNLSIADTIFAQEASGGGSGIELNCSIVEMSSGRLTMSDCAFAGLHLSSSCLAASRGEYFSCAFLNFTDVISGVLMDFHDLAKLSMQQVHASNCSAQRSGLILRNCKDCQLQNIQMRGTPSGSNMIVLSSDGSGGHSNIQGNHLEFDDTRVSSESLVSVECQDTDIEMNFLAVSNTVLGDGCAVSVTSNASAFHLKQSSFQNITRDSLGPCCLAASSSSLLLELENCSNKKCASPSEKGSVAALADLADVCMSSCAFDGAASAAELRENDERSEELCQWSGSMVDLQNCTGRIMDTSVANSSKGGLSVSGGSISVQFGLFANNSPNAAGYPSMRNNIVCSDHAMLNIQSLKEGDGLKENSSLWVLNLGCNLSGIASERASPFFIPQLASVKSHQQGNALAIDLAGSLLLPCGLSLQVDSFDGSVHNLQVYPLQAEEFAGETEIHTAIPASIVTTASEATEVSVKILFGRSESPASTDSFILKNRSEIEPKGDERIVEGGKEGKSLTLIIAVIFIILFLIALIVSIVLAVRWRSAKNENKDLKEIVNDTVKKDPKLIEMVTMEMSPEGQWRRAEREAEKKNDDRIKKRVYEKSLGHSESSEQLLSECSSTEYILGRDSDKIPQWMLEKVDEKEDDDEETRKRTSSPSISSTSTTDTSDTDTTFVRSESLCPTTSSMSNLVDAMACSSPHEKLIVDLRDSLFMLLHGRNEKKEMVIGSLKEREQTAAQILFWVANLALHSFDEMENPLSSLANLSPHIVLFSEHMVICIAMHSDCSSDDSSDSLSISSSTVVTSASYDESDSLPSSAFEDDEDNRYECMRWKAPELLMNKKMGATKESVVFSIGMMLWECLTLQIPFGEYEAEVAGQKIVNGERPSVEGVMESDLAEAVEGCWAGESEARLSVVELKRVFIQHFPKEAVVMTVSDAIDFAT